MDAKTRKEEIKVRKNPVSPATETVMLDVVETRNGVIITEENNRRYALKWTHRDPKNDMFGAFLRLNHAKNWEDFKSALKYLRRLDAEFYLRRRKGKYRLLRRGRDSDSTQRRRKRSV